MNSASPSNASGSFSRPPLGSVTNLLRCAASSAFRKRPKRLSSGADPHLTRCERQWRRGQPSPGLHESPEISVSTFVSTARAEAHRAQWYAGHASLILAPHNATARLIHAAYTLERAADFQSTTLKDRMPAERHLSGLSRRSPRAIQRPSAIFRQQGGLRWRG
jgi:hypothetical protein